MGHPGLEAVMRGPGQGSWSRPPGRIGPPQYGLPQTRPPQFSSPQPHAPYVPSVPWRGGVTAPGSGASRAGLHLLRRGSPSAWSLLRGLRAAAGVAGLAAHRNRPSNTLFWVTLTFAMCTLGGASHCHGHTLAGGTLDSEKWPSARSPEEATGATWGQDTSPLLGARICHGTARCLEDVGAGTLGRWAMRTTWLQTGSERGIADPCPSMASC